MNASPESSKKTSFLHVLFPAFLALSCFLPARSCWAQSRQQEMQQMQDRVQQLEQEVKDLKARLAVVEKAQSTVVAPAPRLTQTVHFQVAQPQNQLQGSDVLSAPEQKNEG